MQKKLRRLRVGLFYGIHPEVLKNCAEHEIDTDNLDPHNGRQLRTIGRLLNLRQQGQTASGDYKKLVELLDDLSEEYRGLISEGEKKFYD